MYTEKITLRLTPEDKTELQIEADEKKLTLGNLIRNKISGINTGNDEDKEFQPQLIHFDEREFSTAKAKSNAELKKWAKIETELKKFIEIPEDRTEALKTPMGYLETIIIGKYAKSIDIPLSFSKLLELLEFDVSTLQELCKFYNSNLLKVDSDLKIVPNVNEDGYRHYTKNNAENERLEKANDFIESYLTFFGKGYQNNKIHQLTRVIGQDIIKYDSTVNTLVPNPKYIRG